MLFPFVFFLKAFLRQHLCHNVLYGAIHVHFGRVPQSEVSIASFLEAGFRIRIKVESWIRIRIRIKVKSRFWIRIRIKCEGRFGALKGTNLGKSEW
jgi:hypothetical protein